MNKWTKLKQAFYILIALKSTVDKMYFLDNFTRVSDYEC